MGESVPLEVYDTESSDWTKFASIQRFRHACWVLENNLYVHGGFEQESPNVPTDNIAKIDISNYFQGHPILSKYSLTNGQDNSAAAGGQKQVDSASLNQSQMTSQLSGSTRSEQSVSQYTMCPLSFVIDTN